MKSQIRCCAFLVATIVVNPYVLAQAGNYSDPAFEKLNGKFRELFAASLTDELKKTTPIILVRGDNLVLMANGERKMGAVVHSNYHDLKTIAHVPLTLFSVLHASCGQQLSDRQLQQLDELRGLVEATKACLSDCFSDPQTLQRQTTLLEVSQAFLLKVTHDRICTRSDLMDFVRRSRQDILLNVRDAARLRIDNYHSQLLRWRKEFSADEWSNVCAIIPGVAAARKENLAVQYFSKAFRQRGEGARVIYAESAFEEGEALNLLGVHLMSRKIGLAFFDDPWRMHRDLLATASGTYLDALDFSSLYTDKE